LIGAVPSGDNDNSEAIDWLEGCAAQSRLRARLLKATMMNRFKIVTLCMSLSVTAVVKAQTVTVGSPQTMLTAPQRIGDGLNYFPDGNMGAFLSNGTYYVFAPVGYTQGITLASLNTWTSGLNLLNTSPGFPLGGPGAFDQDYAGGGAVYLDSKTGILIGLYHGEYWYNPPGDGSVFYAGHGLAYSNDLGVTWKKLGQIVSPQTARSGNCQVDVGTGTLLVVGAYLYDYYVDEGSNCDTNNFNIAVARAPLSAVIAAAQAGTSFTSGAGTLFMKYTGNGSWNGDGVTDLANPQNGGGAFAGLLTGNSYFEPNVAYNSYLNQYVMTYSNSFASLEIRFSSDGLTWGSPTTIVSGGGEPPNGIYYPTLFNASGGDPETLGSTFSLYYVDPFGDWSQSNLMRVQVTVGSPTSPPPALPAPPTQLSAVVH
jgi:hypothetical protein